MSEAQPTILALLAVTAGLGLLVLAVATTTAFVKVSIVLFLVRNALGTQTIPPNVVLYAAAMILTMFVSAPVAEQTYDRMSDPKLHYQTFDDWVSAAKAGSEPLREHLKKFTNEEQRRFFLSSTEKVWPEEMHAAATPDDFAILVPSFLLSELKRGFEMGFLLYLPFIVIDLIVTTILMAMGMSMVSPTVISVPFKIFLFVAIDGWSKIDAWACAELYVTGRLIITESSIITLMSQSLVVFMIWILPPLIASVVVGLVIGILQAATQIQDESLPLTVKLLVVVAVIGLFAPVLSAPLIELADQIFTEFPAMTLSY